MDGLKIVAEPCYICNGKLTQDEQEYLDGKCAICRDQLEREWDI